VVQSQLLAAETQPNRELALKRERQLKDWTRAKKKALRRVPAS
jgi:predicted GIY-YIG superfamily endonuclease